MQKSTPPPIVNCALCSSMSLLFKHSIVVIYFWEVTPDCDEIVCHSSRAGACFGLTETASQSGSDQHKPPKFTRVYSRWNIKWIIECDVAHPIYLLLMKWNGCNLVSRQHFWRCVDIHNFSSQSLDFQSYETLEVMLYSRLSSTRCMSLNIFSENFYLVLCGKYPILSVMYSLRCIFPPSVLY